MVLQGKTALLVRRVKLGHLDQQDLLAEGDQEPQGFLEPMGFQAVSGHKVQLALKVFLDFLVHPDLMASRVFLVLFQMVAEISCVLLSVPLVHLVPLGCRDSRGTQDTRETRESLGKLEKRETLAPLVLQGFQALWAYKAHVV